MLAINQDVPISRNFHCIYRVCDQRPNTYWNNYSKVECLNNFVDRFGKDNLTIIADNMRNPEEIKKMDCTVITTNLGNSQTFVRALDLAIKLPDDDYIYLVEDDYLHKKEAKKILLEGLRLGEFVSLYDHPDKYGTKSPNPLVQHGGELTRVLLGPSCHWKETNSTTMTFACKVKILKETKDTIKKYLDKTIPRDYDMWREITKKYTLISSLPGYSTHCHEPWITPLFDWNKV
jgi:hypothetical protein